MTDNSDDYGDQRKSRNNSNSWSTSEKKLYPSEYLNQLNSERGEKDDNKNSNNANSTLSLHVQAAENSTNVEKSDEQNNVDESDVKKPKKGIIGRTLKSLTNLKNLVTRVPSAEEEYSTPEKMSFKYSQRIFDPSKSNAENALLMNKMGKRIQHDIINKHLPQLSPDFQSLLPGLNLSKENVLIRQAFGRNGALGELYDARKEVFCGRLLFSIDLDPYVKSNNVQRVVTEYSTGNSLNAKFEKHGVEGDIKLSVLSGIIKVNDQCFSADSNDDEINASFVCKLTTKQEAIDVTKPSLIKRFSHDALKDFSSATHVVIGIQKGVRVIADLFSKQQNGDTQDQKLIENELTHALHSLDINFPETVRSKSTSNERLNFHICDNALNDYGTIPQTLEEAITFMKELPEIIKGKEVPVSYIMIPLTFFQKSFKKLDFSDRIVYKTDERVNEEVVEVFGELNTSIKLISTMHEKFSRHYFCLNDDVIQSVSNKLQEVKDMKKELEKHLWQNLVDVRSYRQPSSALNDVMQYYRSSSCSKQSISSFCLHLHTYVEKVRFVDYLISKKVVCIGRGETVELGHMKCSIQESFEYYCDWSNKGELIGNSDLFVKLISSGTQMVFVDLEVNRLARNGNVIPDGNRICRFFKGRYTDKDYLQSWKQGHAKCFVKCMQENVAIERMPIKHADVELPCPQSFKEECCATSKQQWYCEICKQRMQYDFYGHFFCHCGMAPVTAYQFRCSDQKHGELYSFFDEEKLFTLVDEILPNKEINILLLGETGVGKSTFINGFGNYLTYSTLAEAEKASSPVCLIPSQFTTTELVNGKWEERTIKIGESKNESFKIGASSTQEPKSHLLISAKKIIRLIDTPGVGDVGGIEADKRNFASVLQYISQFDEIHGICILLKPNDSRLTLVFKYCINELLAHLHKSAAANIAFCFTHISDTFHRPGNTLPVLKRHVNELYKDDTIKIELTQDTIYCVDNDSFRFLNLLNNGVSFNNDERTIFDKSWEMSVKEIQRLLNHFENDVRPHVVAETVSLNEARQIILTAAKPLADITKMIQQNIKAINRQRSEVEQADAYELKLLGKLMIKHVGIATEPLGYPRTVCCAASCTETKRLPNSKVDNVIYKTVCHEHCYLPDVTPEVAPNPDLQKCKAMGGTMSCTKCGCSWDTHLHITFMQKEVEKEVEDENVRRSIDQNKSAKEVQQDAIKSLEQRIDEFKKSQADIDQILAKFASFLKKNAILAYNDTIEDYLKLNIRDEKEQGNPNSELLKKMEEQLKQYQQEKRILDSRLASGEVQHVLPGDIKILQKELENLPLVGKDFKTLFDAHVQGKHVNLQYGEEHFDPYTYHSNVFKKRSKKNAGRTKGQQHHPVGMFQSMINLFLDN